MPCPKQNAKDVLKDDLPASLPTTVDFIFCPSRYHLSLIQPELVRALGRVVREERMALLLCTYYTSKYATTVRYIYFLRQSYYMYRTAVSTVCLFISYCTSAVLRRSMLTELYLMELYLIELSFRTDFRSLCFHVDEVSNPTHSSRTALFVARPLVCRLRRGP